jgi:hypothetical protein
LTSKRTEPRGLHPDVLIKSTVVGIEEQQKSVVRFAGHSRSAALPTSAAHSCAPSAKTGGQPFAMRTGETEQGCHPHRHHS